MIKKSSLIASILLGFLSFSLAEVGQWRLEDIEISGYRNNSFIQENSIRSSTPIEELLAVEDDRFRTALYRGLWSKINKADNLEDAQDLTELFVQGIDHSPNYVLGRLVLPPFEKEYFSERAAQRVVNNNLAKGYQSMYIRALGVVGIADPDVDTAAIASDPSIFSSDRTEGFFKGLGLEDKIKYDSAYWSALLVEARRGNEEALKLILDELGERDEMHIMDNTQVVEDLGFVRQADAIDLLVRYLFSEIGGPGQPVEGGADYGITPLASRAMKALSLALVDFPYSYWDENVSWDDVKKAREFINNYNGGWRIIGKWKPEERVSEIPPATSEVAETVEELTEVEPAIKDSAGVGTSEPPEGTVKQSSNWWLWLVGLLVFVGALGVVLRRKK